MGELDGELDIVAELDKILSAPPAAEDDAPEAVVEASVSQPEITPEAEGQEDAPEVEANDSEEAQAPAVEVPATKAAAQPKAQSDSSTELEQKLGEASKTAEEAKAARNQYQNALNVLVPQMQAAIAGEFTDIKSQEDLLALADPNNANYNPDRYNRYIMANQRLALAQREQTRVQQESVQATVRSELAQVSKVLPEFTNPETGPALKEKLKAFAKSQNINLENRPFLASDVIALHKSMTAHEELAAFKAEKAKQETAVAEAAKKAAKAPPVQKPGVQRTGNKDEKATTDFSRFQKSGRVDDLAAFLQNIL